jgi:hypothetical protein
MKRDRGVNPLRNQEYQTSDIKVVLTRKKKYNKERKKRRKFKLIPALFVEIFEEVLQNSPR